MEKQKVKGLFFVSVIMCLTHTDTNTISCKLTVRFIKGSLGALMSYGFYVEDSPLFIGHCLIRLTH